MCRHTVRQARFEEEAGTGVVPKEGLESDVAAIDSIFKEVNIDETKDEVEAMAVDTTTPVVSVETVLPLSPAPMRFLGTTFGENQFLNKVDSTEEQERGIATSDVDGDKEPKVNRDELTCEMQHNCSISVESNGEVVRGSQTNPNAGVATEEASIIVGTIGEAQSHDDPKAVCTSEISSPYEPEDTSTVEPENINHGYTMFEESEMESNVDTEGIDRKSQGELPPGEILGHSQGAWHKEGMDVSKLNAFLSSAQGFELKQLFEKHFADEHPTIKVMAEIIFPFIKGKSMLNPKLKATYINNRMVLQACCQRNVDETYRIINKLSGQVGGNGSFGAIYGELTQNSMQKVVNLMKEKAGFSSSSRFIDVGSGLGKPNLHVCQDPGVEFSYGVEMERSRWALGLSNLKGVISAANAQAAKIMANEIIPDNEKIKARCLFDHGNIMDAKAFDPFTHVYMFSIG
jgi:hypothetical protein